MRALRSRLVLPLAAVAALALTAFAVAADSTETDSTATPPPAATAAPTTADTSAAARYRTLVRPDAAGLERAAREQTAAYERQAAAAAALTARVDAVEAAGRALFAEWEAELGRYTNDSLRTLSRERLDEARTRHDSLVTTMRASAQGTAPALAELQDRALTLRHALDARTVGALGTTATSVQTDATAIRTATQAAVTAADRALGGATR